MTTPKRIGARVMVRFERIVVPCTVTGTRFAYGNERYEVAPLGGQGRQIVDSSRIISPENGRHKNFDEQQ